MRSEKNVSTQIYSEHFAKEGAAEQYLKKFDNRLDKLRHVVETSALGAHAHGFLFDCSIATGRFIGVLPKVRAYAGMDYSEDFVNYVRRNYPAVEVTRGDLRDRLPVSNERFDTVICLRTLSTLGHVDHILPEMFRITKSGGTVIFDYGTKARTTSIKGQSISISDYDIEEVLRPLPVASISRIPLDGLLFLMKTRPTFGRLFKACSDETLLKWEAATPAFLKDRVLYVARKG